jgi:hypothetical protein
LQVVVKEDYSGAQAATVESKPGKKKLKKIKKEEREKTKGLSVTQLAFFSSFFWILIRKFATMETYGLCTLVLNFSKIFL